MEIEFKKIIYREDPFNNINGMQSDVASLSLLFSEISVESLGAGSISVETTPLMPNVLRQKIVVIEN